MSWSRHERVLDRIRRSVTSSAFGEPKLTMSDAEYAASYKLDTGFLHVVNASGVVTNDAFVAEIRRLLTIGAFRYEQDGVLVEYDVIGTCIDRLQAYKSSKIRQHLSDVAAYMALEYTFPRVEGTYLGYIDLVRRLNDCDEAISTLAWYSASENHVLNRNIAALVRVFEWCQVEWLTAPAVTHWLERGVGSDVGGARLLRK